MEEEEEVGDRPIQLPSTKPMPIPIPDCRNWPKPTDLTDRQFLDMQCHVMSLRKCPVRRGQTV